MVQSGGRVAFHRVGLEEQQLPVDENDPSWPQGNKLLMSVFALKVSACAQSPAGSFALHMEAPRPGERGQVCILIALRACQGAHPSSEAHACSSACDAAMPCAATSQGASEFMLDSASIRVSNVSRLLADLMALPRGGGAPTSPNLKPVFADPQPQLSPDVQSFTIESWTLTR